MSTWTAWDDPRAEAAADALVGDLSRRTLAAWQDRLEALWIIGGFGRGEGSLRQETGGDYRAWNDVDFVLLLREGAGAPPDADAIAAGWSRETGLDSVDLGWVPAGAWARPRSLFHLEARLGHRALFGTDEAAAALPASVEDLDGAAEARRLLFNRAFALVMLAADPAMQSAPDRLSFRLNAVIKCDMALGDARLLCRGTLPLQYAARPAALAECGAPAEVREAHATAVEHKLRPTQAWAEGIRDVEPLLRAAARRWLEYGPAHADLEGARDSGSTLTGLRSRVGALLRGKSGGPNLDALGRELPRLMEGIADPKAWDPADAAACVRAWKDVK